MKEIIQFLEWRVPVPQPWGPLHIGYIIGTIAFSVLFIWLSKRFTDKQLRRFVLTVWIILVLLEAFKQFIFTFELDSEGNVNPQFQWYVFPFQFCATPLFALPVVCFAKDGKVRDAFMAFMGMFCIIGGILVLIFVDGVTTSNQFINLQSLTYHSLQIIVGLSICAFNAKKYDLSFYLKGLCVFVGFVIAAIILNEAMWPYMKNIDSTFNMFFISRHYPSTLAILGVLWNGEGNPSPVPYVVFVLIYVALFALGGFIFYLIECLSIRKNPFVYSVSKK